MADLAPGVSAAAAAPAVPTCRSRASASGAEWKTLLTARGVDGRCREREREDDVGAGARRDASGAGAGAAWVRGRGREARRTVKIAY